MRSARGLHVSITPARAAWPGDCMTLHSWLAVGVGTRLSGSRGPHQRGTREPEKWGTPATAPTHHLRLCLVPALRSSRALPGLSPALGPALSLCPAHRVCRTSMPTHLQQLRLIAWWAPEALLSKQPLPSPMAQPAAGGKAAPVYTR